ncbi:MAG TPA: 2-C-methyl-D-erythritol 4-phosphate cytidylyltransferase [Thermoanaerobaculia bacterium]|nr:2-C-methyl-D-erythritol 4-phosphate cytidylyltransferase [Thermoanaerobaculia bacterium]
MNCTVIIPAAGSGVRFGGEVPKQYLPLGGRPLIVWTIDVFFRHPAVERIIVAVSGEQLASMQEIVDHNRWGNVRLVNGGETRQDSVRNALKLAIKLGAELVAIHDSVRPLFAAEGLDPLLEAASQVGASLPALPLSDTIHRVHDQQIVETLDRGELVAAQTPQCFRSGLLSQSLDRAAAESFSGTDEAGVFAHYGFPVRVLPGDPGNIKVTRPEDWKLAEALLAGRDA